jgi:hypothetical protein
MYETHKSGWVRTRTNIAKAEKFWHRWKLHCITVQSAIKYGYLDFDIIIGFLVNRKRDFK